MRQLATPVGGAGWQPRRALHLDNRDSVREWCEPAIPDQLEHVGGPSLEGAVAENWAATTPDVFDAEVRHWVETATQPKFEVAYTKLVYKAMLFDLRWRPARGRRR